MNSEIENIVGQVIVVYPSKSAEYESIFRDGMEVYYSDTYYQRIQHLGFLADRLGLHPSMAAAKTKVANLVISITAKRDDQQQKAKALKLASKALELCRINMADMMYANVGLLMDKYCKTREVISSFFNLDLLYGRSLKAVLEKKYSLNIPVTESSKQLY